MTTTHRTRAQSDAALDGHLEDLDAAAVKARMDRTARHLRNQMLAHAPVKPRTPRYRLQSEGVSGVSRWTATTASRKAA